MKCVILLALVAFCSARPNLVFLVPSGQGGTLQRLNAQQIQVLQQNLAPVLNNLQQQFEARKAAEAAAAAAANATAPAGDDGAAAAAAAPADDNGAAVAAVDEIAANADPIANFVDPQFQEFIFPNDAPEIIAAKQAHFSAHQQALGHGATKGADAELAAEAEPLEVEPTAAEIEAAELAAQEAEAAEIAAQEAAEVQAAEAEAQAAAEAEAAELAAAEAAEPAQAEAAAAEAEQGVAIA